MFVYCYMAYWDVSPAFNQHIIALHEICITVTVYWKYYRLHVCYTLRTYPTSSSARLAIPEVVDRPCWNRVESAYWSGDFQKIFFLFDPSLTSGMSVVLMWGHCPRHRPYIKQHMSAGRVAHRKRLRHRPPHLTATCMRVELMVSQRRRQRANIEKTFFEKLMNIQYLNLPPYPNRWMVWLIQQGLAWRPRCVKTCCQEDDIPISTHHKHSSCSSTNQWAASKIWHSRPISYAYLSLQTRDVEPRFNVGAALQTMGQH